MNQQSVCVRVFLLASDITVVSLYFQSLQRGPVVKNEL